MTLRDTLTLSDTLSSSFIHLKFLFYLSKIIFKNFTQLDLEWGNILQLKIEKGGAKGKRETGHCLNVAPSTRLAGERALQRWICRQPWKSLALLSSLPVC
jgi:hypothetical protein